MSVEIRASDDDRQRTIAALQRHTAAGRLTLDEFAERVDAACAARTLGELATVTGDLPADQPDTGPVATDGHSRELLTVFAVAILTLLLLALFMAVTR